MFRGPAAVLSCISIIHILGLLQDVSAFVAQPPNRLVPTEPGSILTVTNTSATLSDGSTTTLSQEDPPFEFRVEYFWKQGGDWFDRMDMFNTLTYNMGYLAVRPWNQPQFVTAFPYEKYHINMKFVGKKTGPVLRVKHLMWILEEIFDIFVENDRYSSGTINVDITPDRLAIGNVLPAPKRTFSSPKPLSINNITENNDLGDSWLTATSPFQDLSPVTNTTTPDSPHLLTAHKPVDIDAKYVENGHTFPVAQIYNATLKFILLTGENDGMDMLDGIGPIVSIYNDMADFTYSFTSSALKTVNSLSWLDCLNALEALTVLMADQGRDGRWAEIDGFIRDSRVRGVVLGKFCVKKGDWRGREPVDVCTLTWPLEVGEGVDVA